MSTSLLTAQLTELVAQLEEEKNAVAARQADAILALGRAIAAEQIDAGVDDPRQVQRVVANRVGLACRVSAHQGGKRVRIARDLHAGHTLVRGMFAAGMLNEQKIAVITDAGTHLDPDERAQLDERLPPKGIETFGVRRLGDLAKKIAAEVNREKFEARTRRARSGRRVT